MDSLGLPFKSELTLEREKKAFKDIMFLCSEIIFPALIPVFCIDRLIKKKKIKCGSIYTQVSEEETLSHISAFCLSGDEKKIHECLNLFEEHQSVRLCQSFVLGFH